MCHFILLAFECSAAISAPYTCFVRAEHSSTLSAAVSVRKQVACLHSNGAPSRGTSDNSSPRAASPKTPASPLWRLPYYILEKRWQNPPQGSEEHTEYKRLAKEVIQQHRAADYRSAVPMLLRAP